MDPKFMAPCAAALAACCALPSALAQPAHGTSAPDEIVVLGTPRRQSADELAQSVTVLRGEALERAQSVNLGETLSSELAVNSSFFGAGASRPVVRGLAGSRVRTMEDGID